MEHYDLMELKHTPRRRLGTRWDVVEYDDETWLEKHLAGWTTAIRVVSQEGHPVVAEVRVFPSDTSPNRVPGTWDDRLPIPKGGIRDKTMKQAKVPTMLTRTRALLADMAQSIPPSQLKRALKHSDPYLIDSDLIGAGFFAIGLAGVRSPSHDHPGRGGNDPAHEDLLYFVIEYIKRHEDGQHDAVNAIAESLWPGKDRREQVGRRLDRARRLGLITRPPLGKVGGELTDKGRQALANLGHPPRAPW